MMSPTEILAEVYNPALWHEYDKWGSFCRFCGADEEDQFGLGGDIEHHAFCLLREIRVHLMEQATRERRTSETAAALAAWLRVNPQTYQGGSESLPKYPDYGSGGLLTAAEAMAEAGPGVTVSSEPTAAEYEAMAKANWPIYLGNNPSGSTVVLPPEDAPAEVAPEAPASTEVELRCPQCGAEGRPDCGGMPLGGEWWGFGLVIPEGRTEARQYCQRCWQKTLVRADWPPPAVPVDHPPWKFGNPDDYPEEPLLAKELERIKVEQGVEPAQGFEPVEFDDDELIKCSNVNCTICSAREWVEPEPEPEPEPGGPPPGASSEPDPELTAAAEVVPELKPELLHNWRSMASGKATQCSECGLIGLGGSLVLDAKCPGALNPVREVDGTPVEIKTIAPAVPLAQIVCPRCHATEIAPATGGALPDLPQITLGGPFMAVGWVHPAYGKQAGVYCRACWGSTVNSLVTGILPCAVVLSPTQTAGPESA